MSMRGPRIHPSRWVFIGLAGQIVAFLFLDWTLDQQREGLTLSEGTRATFDEIYQGRLVWSGVWFGFAGWFWWHIEHKMTRKWWQ